MDLDKHISADTCVYKIDLNADYPGAHILRIIGQGKRVLEIGAGPGSISRPLAEVNGCEVTAIEIDPNCIPILTKFCRHVVQADLNDPAWTQQIPERAYDFVVIADVLEHLYDPWKTLRAASELIGPEGSVLISLPHASHAALAACLLSGDFRYGDWGLLDRTHIRFFSLKNMQALIEGAGLRVADAKFITKHPDDTEFADIWRSLPRSTHTALLSAPGAEVYQAVVRCVRASAVGALPERQIVDFLPSHALSTKFIAFYLPQFHPVPENDEWWGKGFTEWRNVTKSQPLFDSHYQPHLPADLGFYDLRLPEIRHEQIALAQKYGVDAFCFHYYWFNGRRILERPVEDYLADRDANFPFCLCWANESWSRRWDGSEEKLLIEQVYSVDGDIALIRDLQRFFVDPRYVRVDGKPLFVVYRPQQLPDARATTIRWRDACRTAGIGEIHLVAALTHNNTDFESMGFDAGLEFPPHNLQPKGTKPTTSKGKGMVVRYEDVAQNYLRNDYRDRLVYRGVYPSWDNTARVGERAAVTVEATPANYQTWLYHATKQTELEREPEHRMVFINAWNEWAEGCHLEPDQKFGHAFLEATARVKSGEVLRASTNPLTFVPGVAVVETRAPLLRPLARWLGCKLRSMPAVHAFCMKVWQKTLSKV